MPGIERRTVQQQARRTRGARCPILPSRAQRALRHGEDVLGQGVAGVQRLRRQAMRGEGVEETGRCSRTGQTLVSVDPRYYRPTEVDLLIGDPTKAHQRLGWRHETSVRDLVGEMVREDLRLLESEHAPLSKDV